MDAVFRRRYAKYRHMPYPDPSEDEWRSDFMQRTWINILLHEGMTDELRTELYPGRFDLGNAQSDNNTRVDFSELLREINGAKKAERGESVGVKQAHDWVFTEGDHVCLTGIPVTIPPGFCTDRETSRYRPRASAMR
jgi:hypothetical protein